MKKKILIIQIILMAILSIISIYSSSFMMSIDYKYLHIKQAIWFLIGFFLILIIYKQNNNFFYKYVDILYYLGLLSLILVLIFGTNVNGSKAWFSIPKIGSIQPSELMKIFLILKLSKILNENEKKERIFKNEIYIILKCLLFTLIPALLTFLEPDTGNVILYFIICFIMLFIYGIRYRWFITFIIILSLLIISFLYLYFYKKDIFINIFGTNFFYRMDRIVEWKNKEGMQLENALAAIGSSPPNGYGIKKTPIYFPEPHTDFIISIIFSNFGFYLSIFILFNIFLFDINLIFIGLKNSKKNKYLIGGTISILLFQQIQNIGMNIGLLPITGITLPFISYGGSSLISYMILIGLILNANKKNTN